MTKLANDVAPHEFTPYRWYDRFHRRGRCADCLFPKWVHPVHCWMTARPRGHGEYYDWRTVVIHRAIGHKQ